MKQEHWERNINSQEFSTETRSSENINSMTPKVPHVKQLSSVTDGFVLEGKTLENQPPNKSKALQIKEQSYCPSLRLPTWQMLTEAIYQLSVHLSIPLLLFK